MIKITKKYYLLLLLLGYAFAYTNNETGWEYTQGTQQCFYMFEDINIDDISAIGDGQPANNYSGECISNFNTCDVIGAFIQRDESEFGDLNGDGEISSSVDVCVGWIYVNSDGWTTIPLIGTVPGDLDLLGYLDEGDIPIFKIYDHQNSIILPLDISNLYYSEYFDDLNGNEQWDAEQSAEPFTDSNGNGQWDDDELFDDDNGNNEWDEGEYFYDGNNMYDEGEEFEDSNGNGVYDDGEDFIDSGNGVYDYAELFEDLNGNGIYDDYAEEEFFQDINGNGVYDSIVQGDLLGWSYNEIFLYQGSVDAYNIYGCNDDEACNYDFGTTANDGSCLYSPSGDIVSEVIIDNNNIEFSWEAPLLGSPDFQYQVKLFDDNNVEVFNEYNSVSPLFFDNLDWSTEYTIELTTTNYDICEPLISFIVATTDSMPAPGQANLSDPISGQGEIFLSWDSVEYGSIYKIYSNNSLLDSTSLTTYVDDELAPNIDNSYQILSVNMEGTEGNISDAVIGSTLPLSNVTLDSVLVGQGQLEILWSMENSQLSYANESYVFDIYMNDAYLTTRYGTYHIVNNLDSDEEYCFYIIPRVNLIVDGDITEFSSNQSNSICASPDEVSGWSILIESQLNAWESELIYDIYNELGMRPEASDNYDSQLDIPEPPVTGGLDYWLSLSFPHPEWNLGIGGVPQEYFTSDLRGLKDLSKTIEVWDASLISSAPGSGLLSFNFISDAGGYPIYLYWNNLYTRIYDDSIVDFIYNTPEEQDDFKIIVGDQSPGIPIALDVIGESREMLITWNQNTECHGNGDECSNYSNRYPATSYKVYRSWYEETDPHIIALVGTRHEKISILPIQLNSISNDSFEIINQPVDGYIESEYFESYLDLNSNGEYDVGEEFSDCGWDGLCPGDEGYEEEIYSDLNNNGEYDLGEDFLDINFNGVWDQNGPDIGENDGIYNKVYYYQANEYFVEGYDSLSYVNDAYDFGEEYSDSNSNGEWDEGEDFIDAPRFLKIKINDNLESSYLDAGLNTGTLYFYNILASNGAGESLMSITDSDETAPNIRPTADAGINQTRYIISANDSSVVCTFPLDNVYDEYGYEVLDELGNPVLDNINNSFDPDGLSSEPLIYYWEILDPNSTLNLSQPSIISNDPEWWQFGNNDVTSIELPETSYLDDEQYLVRLYVQDISGYISEPDTTTIKVTRDIPIPSYVDNITAQENLYYIKLFWDESSYDAPGAGPNQAPDGYDGDLELADYYVVYRDSIEHQIVSSDTLFFVDNGLSPQEPFIDENDNSVWDYGEEYEDENNNGYWDFVESHCYYIIAVNGTGESLPSDEHCFATGELPVPEILAPSGGEILTSGQTTSIEWNIVESNMQFIDSVSVYHSSDAGINWTLEGSWSSSNIPVYFDFTVPETDTISFYNKFKVEVLDIGDYGGINKQVHTDLTNHLIIIANNNLQHDYSSGWNLVSSPLELESSNVWDNFMGDDDDILNFLIYSQDEEVCGFPQCDNQLFDFQIGEGFYMISQQNSTLGLEGDILENHTIELNQGWNLIGNPLVAKVLVDSLEVINNGQLFSWDEAVGNRLVLPTIHGFSNSNSRHEPSNVIEPFSGYWVYALDNLELIIEPHIYDESLYTDQREDDFKLILYAEEHQPHPAMLDLLWNDMIEIGLSQNASDGMISNEDQYDIPVTVNPASFTNIFIDHPEWESSGIAETRRFYSDMRVLEGPDIAKTWNLTGQLLGNVISDSLLLSWETNNISLLNDHDITLVVAEEIINMKEANSVVINKEYFENMQIVVGPLVNAGSCEAQGLVECEDGTCVTFEEDCIELSNESIPVEFSLSEPYPNPFNPSVKLDFSLSETQLVDISVYNVNGEYVDNIMNDIKTIGYHNISWNASLYPTGIYFIRFSSKESTKTMKVMLIK